MFVRAWGMGMGMGMWERKKERGEGEEKRFMLMFDWVSSFMGVFI